jgi:hypothetical protein
MDSTRRAGLRTVFVHSDECFNGLFGFSETLCAGSGIISGMDVHFAA